MTEKAEKNHPYINLPSSAFWRTAVAAQPIEHVTGLYTKKWQITKDTKIATAGSCFAQHITQQLINHEWNVLIAELPPPSLPAEYQKLFGYSLFSARYGNVYTTTQLLQLAKEAFGQFVPADPIWKRDNRYYDALRPNIEPNGFATVAEVIQQREYHLSCVRDLLLNFDLFIFTFGLTESWVHSKTGTVYPIAPGTIAGVFDPLEYELKNYKYLEVLESFKKFMSFVTSVRHDRKPPKYLLTVSPVPLTATASGNHILVANTQSKSILRAAISELTEEYQHIDYYPSYEIITSISARSKFYDKNLRSIRQAGVDLAMKRFFSAHATTDADPTPKQPATESKEPDNNVIQEDADAFDVICEEELIEGFRK